MSVLIKNMNIPKDCWGCKFRRWENGYGDLCIITGAFIKDVFIKEKDCPLVEVPTPHGDLVDRDKLMVDLMDSDLDHLQRDDWKEVIQIVEDAQTIIEAEGRKI